MRYFHSFKTLFCFVFLLESLVVGQYNHNPLLELPSRDEVVEMAGYGEEKLSTVLVTGSVNCEVTTFHSGGAIQPRAWPIQGVLVSVNCHSHSTKRRSKSMVAQGVTDEFGDFIVDIPSHLHAIPNLEKICRVKILRIPKGSLCQQAHVKRQKGLRLESFGNGIRTYSAGNIRFKHSM
ncbi:hypothetical protein TanjilG_31759 [Lupinus angustifolius]|uniref:Pollen Ole e 1 allergen and extensin family protein n=1 Tax=Lupinus angustifolius TaxID=3871 RepID=A0A4P1RMH3_LUPAN|nr:PREDICTED: uncharacterized protein LOC109345462 isoform X2 [Lupinus angustifolius]OIW13870.1 hypothetical protein TanjilG_31759 [Lupinus angustifolius]